MSFASTKPSPLVVLAYHRARTAWETLAYAEIIPGDRVFGGREYSDYLRADLNMAEAIRGAGGELHCGDTRYRLTPKGIEVSRAYPELSKIPV